MKGIALTPEDYTIMRTRLDWATHRAYIESDHKDAYLNWYWTYYELSDSDKNDKNGIPND